MVMVVLPQRSGEVGGDKVIHALFCVAPGSGLWWTWISWMLYPLLGLLIEWLLDWCGRVVCSSIRFPCPSTLLSLTPPLLLPRLVGRLSWWWRYIMVFSRLKGRLSWWRRQVVLHRLMSSGSSSPKGMSRCIAIVEEEQLNLSWRALNFLLSAAKALSQ